MLINPKALWMNDFIFLWMGRPWITIKVIICFKNTSLPGSWSFWTKYGLLRLTTGFTTSATITILVSWWTWFSPCSLGSVHVHEELILNRSVRDQGKVICYRYFWRKLYHNNFILFSHNWETYILKHHCSWVQIWLRLLDFFSFW